MDHCGLRSIWLTNLSLSPGERVLPRGSTSLPPPPLSGDTPQRPDEETAPAHGLRDRLVPGPSLPKPPPFPAGNECFRQPGKSGYLGGSLLKALSSNAGELDPGLQVFCHSAAWRFRVPRFFSVIDATSSQFWKISGLLNCPDHAAMITQLPTKTTHVALLRWRKNAMRNDVSQRWP